MGMWSLAYGGIGCPLFLFICLVLMLSPSYDIIGYSNCCNLVLLAFIEHDEEKKAKVC